MGMLDLKQGHDADAVEEFRHAVQLDPNDFQLLASVAHVLAADQDPRGRDGNAAVALSLKANALTGGSQPFVLDVVGMACAEVGRFPEAQQAAQQALDLARNAKMTKIGPIEERLKLYQQHQPWRESFLATNRPAGR